MKLKIYKPHFNEGIIARRAIAALILDLFIIFATYNFIGTQYSFTYMLIRFTCCVLVISLRIFKYMYTSSLVMMNFLRTSNDFNEQLFDDDVRLLEFSSLKKLFNNLILFYKFIILGYIILYIASICKNYLPQSTLSSWIIIHICFTLLVALVSYLGERRYRIATQNYVSKDVVI